MYILKANANNLCRGYFAKNPKKICNMRPDTLAQLLYFGNAVLGQNTLVYDNAAGLVLGSIAERLNGYGTIFAAYEKSYSYSMLKQFQVNKTNIQYVRLDQLPPMLVDANLDLEAMQVEDPERAARISKSIADRQERHNQEQARLDGIRQGLMNAGVGALFIVDEGDPTDMFNKLYPYLNLSGTFAVYCTFLEPLTNLYSMLQQSFGACNLRLFETWYRKYQVLPNRTHPTMQTSATGGYILSGYKIENTVFPSDGPKPKKVKTEE